MPSGSWEGEGLVVGGRWEGEGDGVGNDEGKIGDGDEGKIGNEARNGKGFCRLPSVVYQNTLIGCGMSREDFGKVGTK